MSDIIRAQFKKLLESKKQGALATLLRDTKFRQLPEKERQDLAFLAVEHGIAALNRSSQLEIVKGAVAAKGGDSEVFKQTVKRDNTIVTSTALEEEPRPYFELATKLCPLSSDIYLLQARAYFEQGVKKNHDSFFARALILAKKARSCSKQSSETLLVIAEILSKLMERTHRASYLNQSHKVLKQLEALDLNREQLAQVSEMRGRYWKESFGQSQEPIDLEHAVQWFQKAISFGDRKYLHLEITKIWVLICTQTSHVASLIRAKAHLSLFEQYDMPTFTQSEEALFLHIVLYNKIGGSVTQIHTHYETLNSRKEALSWDSIYRYGLFLVDAAWDQKSKFCLSQLKTLVAGLQGREFECITRSKDMLSWTLLQAELLCLEGVLQEKPALMQQALYLLNSHCSDPKEMLSIKDECFWLAKGRIELELGRFFDSEKDVFIALQSLQRALLLDTGNHRLWYVFARAYFCYGEMKDEVSSIQKSVTLFNQARAVGEVSPYFWHDWALSLLKLSEWDGDFQSVEDAIACFEKAIDMMQSLGLAVEVNLLYLYGSAWDYLGEITDSTQGSPKAIAILKEVVAMDPEHTDARYNLALAYLHYGQNFDDLPAIEESCAIFTELVRDDHEDDYLWNELGVALLHRAALIKSQKPELVQKKKKDIENAKIALKRAVAMQCDHGFYNLACAYALNGESDEALIELEKSLKRRMHPSSAEIEEDEWLENLQEYPKFKKILADIKEHEKTRDNKALLALASDTQDSQKNRGADDDLTDEQLDRLEDLLGDYESEDENLFED